MQADLLWPLVRQSRVSLGKPVRLRGDGLADQPDHPADAAVTSVGSICQSTTMRS